MHSSAFGGSHLLTTRDLDEACPACTRSAGGVQHTGTCAIGREIEQIADRDRLWFERNSHTTRYYRQITRAEALEYCIIAKAALGGVNKDVSVSGRVEVVKIRPGVRSRVYNAVKVKLL